jgi:serine/threonine protein kinase
VTATRMRMAGPDEPRPMTVGRADTVVDSEPPIDHRVGEVLLGRYRLLERLGSGGMGTVYEAEQLSTQRHVAVKVLRPGLGQVEVIRRRFEREALAAARLDHPHIVDVVDYGVLDDTSVFLVMEMVRGVSLGALIEHHGAAALAAAEDGTEIRAGLPAAQALTVARQILSALVAAHAAGVVHRDLKPDNVMIVADAGGHDHAMLLDFGIAKLLGDELTGEQLTQLGVAFGTPEYMSPEQARGEPVDARADQYAFGVLLFELITGLRPFETDDKLALLHLHMQQAPPTLGERGAGVLATPALEALVARCLAKQREDRFGDTAELLAALDAATTPILGRGPTLTQALARKLPSRRHRRVRAAVVLGLLALVGGAFLWMQHGRTRAIGPSYAPGLMSLASAQAGQAREGGALAAYAMAIAADPGQTQDPLLVAHVTRLAAGGTTIETRERARDLAGVAGVLDRVDLLSSYLRDLVEPGPCERRKQAIAPLRALKDKRALIGLKKARAGGTDNACLARDAREAIDFLEALP